MTESTQGGQIIRPTTGGMTKRKAKEAEQFDDVDLKTKPPETDLDAIGNEDHNLTAAMIDVADNQFQHAAKAYADRCVENMAELEQFIRRCQNRMYDGITLSLSQQFGEGTEE